MFITGKKADLKTVVVLRLTSTGFDQKYVIVKSDFYKSLESTV